MSFGTFRAAAKIEAAPFRTFVVRATEQHSFCQLVLAERVDEELYESIFRRV